MKKIWNCFLISLKKIRKNFLWRWKLQRRILRKKFLLGRWKEQKMNSEIMQGIWISTILFHKGVNLWNNVQFQFESEFQKKNCAL